MWGRGRGSPLVGDDGRLTAEIWAGVKKKSR